ncbi:hypothetical protein GDO81_011497 [Engystomops pustulosus]|uniref:Ig-like domain-containing protein n=1 Tax=Engystomops pustulosus TaxID=76066 RepID=A0AAV7BEF4_ENGPU|nr:hypothetical protein GDO81_011497 [Engystomops pustulosus]
MTQDPEIVSVFPGDTVTISCTASESLLHPTLKYDIINWYQQKPGKPSRLIIQKVSERPSGIPERFQGSGATTKFTLTINGCTEDDAAEYFCQQGAQFPVTQ